jgi:repressor of nif and glnA expression
VTADFVLAILQESDRPIAVGEIREQLVVRGREPLGRQGMSYVLLGLERDGKAKRIRARDGRARHLWQAFG